MHELAHLINELFSWPSGIVVGNLIASALWAAPALLHLHRKLERHHREQLRAIARKPPATAGIPRLQRPRTPGSQPASGATRPSQGPRQL